MEKMNELVFTPVTQEEMLDLQQLSRDTFRETYAAFNTPENLQQYLEQNLSLEQLTAEQCHPQSDFYFAKMGNELAGFIKINFAGAQTTLNKANSLEIERIYVRKAFQGNSIGKQLFQKAVALARENKCTMLWLGVWEHNTKAMEFYKKMGLTVFDSHDFILGDDVQKDWLMQLELKEHTPPLSV